MKAETKFIRQIQKLSEDEEFQKRHIRNIEKDFKRTRKLRFSDVIMYSIGNTKSNVINLTVLPLEIVKKLICHN